MSYADEVLTDSPLIYWKLDEASGNFADSSGNGTTANPFGTAATYQQPGAVDGGYSILNSTDVRAGIGTDFVLSDPNVFTVEAWIKTTASANTHGIVEAGSGSFSFRVDGSTGLLQLIKSHQALEGNSTVAVNDGEWHHVVARRNGSGTSAIWIDGVDRSGSMADNTFTGNDNQFGFGAEWVASTASPDANSYFIGNLDEIAIYDAALSDERIAAHFAAGQEQAPQVLSMQSHVFGHNMW